MNLSVGNIKLPAEIYWRFVVSPKRIDAIWAQNHLLIDRVLFHYQFKDSIFMTKTKILVKINVSNYLLFWLFHNLELFFHKNTLYSLEVTVLVVRNAHAQRKKNTYEANMTKKKKHGWIRYYKEKKNTDEADITKKNSAS